MKVLKGAKRRFQYNKGQTMTEYVLIMSAVVVALISAYTTLGNIVSEMVTTITNHL